MCKFTLDVNILTVTIDGTFVPKRVVLDSNSSAGNSVVVPEDTVNINVDPSGLGSC
jgi:hypothetical protein